MFKTADILDNTLSRPLSLGNALTVQFVDHDRSRLAVSFGHLKCFVSNFNHRTPFDLLRFDRLVARATFDAK